ncbi:hypothetical protein TNCV_4714201 [Trichonephila clavipes]|nr:hypothetical protein TNCV_4714201 [Trichonephila clavipes]
MNSLNRVPTAYAFRTKVGILSIAIDQWTSKTLWGDRLKISRRESYNKHCRPLPYLTTPMKVYHSRIIPQYAAKHLFMFLQIIGVQNVKLGGHQTCLSIHRLWHELCDVLRHLVGTTALDIMIVQFRNEKVSNHGCIPITIDCNVVAFIVFEEGFHQPIKRTKQQRHFGVCSKRKNIIQEDSDDEQKMNNAAPVPRSSELRNVMKSIRRHLDVHYIGEMNKKMDDISNNVFDKLIC